MGAKTEVVVKSNRLIEASYRLDLVEQRLVLLAIVRARETGKGLNAVDFVPITAKDYAERFGIDEKNAYRQLKEAEESLFYREFTLHDSDPETGNHRVIKGRWVSAASYIDGSGTIQLQFSGVILPYINNLEEKFTRYKLEKIARMSSPYAIRLYELLLQWTGRGWRDVAVSWLRDTLMVPADEYPRLFDLKKRVIDVAVSQINEHSDLTVRYTQRKTGRNVTHFAFEFAPKEAPKLPPPPAPDPSPLVQRLQDLGIGPKLAAQWAKENPARAEAAAAYVEAKVSQGEIRGRAAGYLREVYESGGGFGPSAFEAGEKARAKAAAAEKRRAEAEEKARQRAEAEAAERARQAVNALAPEVLRVFAAEYRAGAGAALAWDEAKGNFRSAPGRLQFRAWLAGKFKSSQGSAG